MLTLITPEGVTLTADSDVELADKWGQLEHGDEWDSARPFTEHTAMWAYLEALAELRSNPTPGYTLTLTGTGTGTGTDTDIESETDQ